MLGVGTHAEQSAVDLGVQGLDPAVEHLGEAGELGDILDGQTGVSQQLGGAARGEDLDAELGEAGYERDQVALVRNADERTSYVEHAGTWRSYWMSE